MLTPRAAPSADLGSAAPARGASAAAAQRHWQEGRALAQRGRWPEAALAFQRAMRKAPGDALYAVNLANACRHQRDWPAAEAAARQALALQPGLAMALQVLGEALAQMHRYHDAEQVLAELQALGGCPPEAVVSRARMLMAQDRHDQAVPLLLSLLAQQPALVTAHAALGDALRGLGHRAEAAECMKTVLALEPGALEARAQLFFQQRHECDWTEWDQHVQALHQALQDEPGLRGRMSSAFTLLSLDLPPELQTVAARLDARALSATAVPLPPLVPPRQRDGRLRVGWFSYDFREHPVSQLLVEVLEQFDRSAFELLLYSSGPDDASPLRQRVVAAADRFVDVRGLSDAQAAARMRDDGVDILVDLMGHTRGHRLGVLACRPAPLQLAFLGYPGSSGAAFIDYLVGDPLVTPLELAPLYTEKLAQMPLCFQPNGRWRPLPQPMDRAQAGLPEDAFVMCAFNHAYKLSPAALDAWCAVMHELPQAVLWLKDGSEAFRGNLRREAAARGVDPARLLFAPRVSYAQHFSRLALADVFVDTWPYNAHTTAADALWAGLPVVTLHGNGFASRVAASVLNAAGLGELALSSVHDYMLAIVTLARDASLCAGYRRHLLDRRQELPLFDSASYSRDLGRLLQRMWARWRTGQAAAHLPAEPAPDGLA